MFLRTIAIFFFSFTLLPSSRADPTQVQVEAFSGEPFGVGRITLPLTDELSDADTGVFQLLERDDRTLYPVFRTSRSLALIRGLMGDDQSGAAERLSVYFLFTGSEPLQLTLHAPARQEFLVKPLLRPASYQQTLRGWWLRYKAAVRRQQRIGDYPPIVELYLTTMLAQRVGQPDWRMRIGPRQSAPQEALELLLQLENVRLRMMQDTLINGRDRQVADQPVPPDIRWREPRIAAPANVKLEAIASHVPEECFYIRFGQFSDYLWLRRLLEEYGGDLSRMVTLRGTDARLNARAEDQLGIRETRLARILGDQVISGVALIGCDTFLREGAAIGILFEARNDLLAQDLQQQRQAAVRRAKTNGATLKTVAIAGRNVSLASSPDNRLRSFYVKDDNYHLVTNCEALARRFLEAGAGQRSLGRSAEFRLARQLMPIDENHNILVYLPRAFFRELFSPQYQIELWRRLRSVTDSEMLQLARLAARSEDQPAETMADLIGGGFLPCRVDQREDGSRTIVGDSKIVDSVRGARGYFLPIPDVPLGKLTQSEADRYRQLAKFYEDRWESLDPMLLGIRRFALDDQNTERVAIDARMLPFNKEKYGAIATVFGPPTRRRFRQLPDDVVSIQAVIERDGLVRSDSPYHLSFGIRDEAPRTPIREGKLLRGLQIARTAPAYLAAWPKPGVLDLWGSPTEVDEQGYLRLPFGLRRGQTADQFSVASFDPAIISNVVPQLEIEEADDEAQVRVHVGDISTSRFGEWANQLDFEQAWETSLGNARFLNMLTQQLKVPVAEAYDTARSLLDVELICALGGEYKLTTRSNGLQHWESTGWSDGKDAAMSCYESPLMNWLRGLDATVTLQDDRLLAQAWLDIQRDNVEQGGKLPDFNKLFGGSRPPNTSGERQPSDPAQLPKSTRPSSD